MIRGIDEKTIVSIIISDKRPSPFPVMSEIRQEHHCTVGPTQYLKARGEKKEAKLSIPDEKLYFQKVISNLISY